MHHLHDIITCQRPISYYHHIVARISKYNFGGNTNIKSTMKDSPPMIVFFLDLSGFSDCFEQDGSFRDWQLFCLRPLGLRALCFHVQSPMTCWENYMEREKNGLANSKLPAFQPSLPRYEACERSLFEPSEENLWFFLNQINHELNTTVSYGSEESHNSALSKFPIHRLTA